MTNVTYEVAHAHLNCRFVCGVLSGLPVPGTNQFGELMRALQPFETDSSRVTVSSLSGRLSDVALSIGVLKGEAQILFTYTGFELSVPSLLEAHLPLLVQIARPAWEAVRDFQTGGKQRYDVSYRAHLRVAFGATTRFMNARLPAPSGRQMLPHAFAFKIANEPSTLRLESKVMIAQSLALEEGLYVEVSLSYDGSLGVAEVSSRAQADIPATLSGFGLERSQSESPV